MEPATRRRAGDPDRGGLHHPRRAGRAAAADRGDRREPSGAAAGPRPAARRRAAATRAAGSTTASISGIAAATGRLWGLTAALTTDERTGLTGTQYTAPLREDMLRALSQSVPPDARNGLAQQRLTTVGRTVDDLFGAVTIVNPGGSYTLATERSPLPLALRNDLPVPIRVRLQVDAPPGMSVTDMGEIELPPGYLPLQVPIEVHFTQRVAVDVALRTADGLPLGEPVRLSVHSNAYGKVLFFITLSAGAVLVAARRPPAVAPVPRPARPRRPGPPGSARRRDRPRDEPDEPPRAIGPKSRRGIVTTGRRAAAGAATVRQRRGPAGSPPPPPRRFRRRPAAGLPAAATSPSADAAPPPRQRIPRGPAPRRRAGRPELSDAAVVSRSWGMAFATLVSRHHRLHPHRAAGRHPGCGAVQRLLGGQPAAQPRRGAGAGGDVHRDLRAGAGPRRARRPRRRHRVRPPARHAGHRAAVGRDGAVGDGGAAAGRG